MVKTWLLSLMLASLTGLAGCDAPDDVVAEHAAVTGAARAACEPLGCNLDNGRGPCVPVCSALECAERHGALADCPSEAAPAPTAR